jgi:hypothetical protein
MLSVYDPNKSDTEVSLFFIILQKIAPKKGHGIVTLFGLRMWFFTMREACA